MVSDAVYIQPILEPGLPAELDHRQRIVFADVDVAVVPSGFSVDEHSRAVRALPPKYGRTLLPYPGVVMTTAGAAGIVVLHPTLSENCGDGVGVAECIGFPIHLDIFRF